ncbi:hypothetical protein HED48_22465 [Ochrobactrum intermedium]|nr:hypothetical protein [Brucella intermedia]
MISPRASEESCGLHPTSASERVVVTGQIESTFLRITVWIVPVLLIVALQMALRALRKRAGGGNIGGSIQIGKSAKGIPCPVDTAASRFQT